MKAWRQSSLMAERADAVMAELFSGPREPRSDAYKAGVRAALRKHFEGVSIIDQLHYPAGSAERDAFFAGTDEGHAKAHQLPARVKTNGELRIDAAHDMSCVGAFARARP